nr:PAS domain-containing protein [Rhizobium gallicum]
MNRNETGWCAVRHQTIIDIHDYWNRLRGASDAPLKSQIEPSSLGHLLPSLFILEKNDELGAVTFRLAGTRICDLFGRDLRDESFAELFADGHADDIEATLLGAMHHVIPTLLNATGYSTAGHQATFEIIVMPLRCENGCRARLLGAIAPSAAASWLEIVPLDFLALDRSRLLRDKPGQNGGGSNWPYTAVAEPPHGFSVVLGRMMSSLFSGVAPR